MEFAAEQRRLYDAACAKLDAARLGRTLMELVNIPSPTGAERAAIEFAAERMRERSGGRVAIQPINGATANTFCEMRGAGGGAALMLYAPIDTHLEGDPARDFPWAASAPRADLAARARAEGDLIYGLGAANPKGMVATLIEIAAALRESGAPLTGDLIVAFAGGGMPVNVAERGNYGMSDGAYHLLSRGVAPDFAIIMKPFARVYAEEPGMCWFKITVRGTLGYAGIPRGAPGYRPSIAPAAWLIEQLERWLPEYTARNTAGEIAPEGHVAAVRAGWPEKPAFPSAATEIYLDLRCNPRTSPAAVKAQFAAALGEIRTRRADLDCDWEMIGACPGGMTDPNNWIVQSARRGWELVRGRPHGDPPKLSGQTDGALIRRLGIPCARVGFTAPPRKCPPEYREGLGGMGVVGVNDLIECARIILYAAIDTLTRPRAALGL